MSLNLAIFGHGKPWKVMDFKIIGGAGTLLEDSYFGSGTERVKSKTIRTIKLDSLFCLIS
jgi:hypothetical protein